MTRLPLVSVVVPLYNKAATVAAAIESVLAQSLGDLELIVIDDGSADAGPAAVAALEDRRLTLLGGRHAGVSAARNRGLAAARAGVVAFLDADDLWMPDHLERIWRLRERFPQCAVYATSYVVRTAQGAESPAVLRNIPAAPWVGVLEDYFGVAAVSSPPLCSSSVAATADALRSVGGFPEGVETGEDLVTWARLACRHRIAFDATPSAVFRKGAPDPAGFTRSPDPADPVGQELERLLAEHGGAGLRRYVATWHRMRASIYLQLGRSKEARGEIGAALRAGEPAGTALRYGLFALLPGNLAQRWFLRAKGAAAKRRRAGKETGRESTT